MNADGYPLLIPLSALPDRPPCCDAVGEQNYRRGYYAGYRMAVWSLSAVLSAAPVQAAYHFLETLLRPWVRRGQVSGASSLEFPPTWRVPTSQISPMVPRTRFLVLQRDQYRCRLCGAAADDGMHVRLEVDHITPRAQGGSDEMSNLWTLCFACNRGKGVSAL